jgi:hypothetical protein
VGAGRVVADVADHGLGLRGSLDGLRAAAERDNAARQGEVSAANAIHPLSRDNSSYLVYVMYAWMHTAGSVWSPEVTMFNGGITSM